MFGLRRLPSSVPGFFSTIARGNATLTVSSQITPESSQPPPSKAKSSEPDHAAASKNPSTDGEVGVTGTTEDRKKRRKIPPKRPSISFDTPRSWNRPLREGVVPAYDLALSTLKRDSANLKLEAKQMRINIKEKEAGYQELKAKMDSLREVEGALEKRLELKEELQKLDQELEKMLEKLHIVEVQSEVNLPNVRWKVNNAMADMSKIEHRHLVEQKWRKDGALHLLMERLYQMNVVPDVLPELNPNIDLHVVARTTPREFLESKKVRKAVEPGAFLKPKQTLDAPKLHVNVFHADERLYTMLLVDPDVPNPESESFTTYLHWMKPNIALSASSPSRIPNLNTHTRYIPPHPQRGSPYHRYICLLLPQPPLGASEYTLTAASRATGPTSVHLDIPIVSETERFGFNIREFMRRWNLSGAKGGAGHMWREIWDEDVTAIYKDILKREEPRYGRPPKMDGYAHIKEQKKYIL
ncbi:phosphatidylethanolamine-binding protein [Crassisporium funariophilum]|nr:phosphatidylethanolamine-binding protein [Crassisporium funariophilum]